MIIDGIFKNLPEQTKEYQDMLFSRLVHRDQVHGDFLLPRYFYIPSEYIEIERNEPGTSPKLPCKEG